MREIFISGTGTDVGKTYISCRIIEALREKGVHVAVKKPVISGYCDDSYAESDGALLLQANREDAGKGRVEAVSPFRFRAPQSPDIAAAMENKALLFDGVVTASCLTHEADITLIEGAGGLMTPLSASHHTCDWVKALRVPVILVGGCYLGGISHMLTALTTAKAYDIPVAGCVINAHHPYEQTTPAAAFMASLTAHTGEIPMFLFPENGSKADVADLVNIILTDDNS